MSGENATSQPVAETETEQQEETEPQERGSGQIYLYGERHSEELIIAKEFELWNEYYHKGGLRHLLIESPYYTAEFLNLYMKSDSTEMLDAVFDDWQGTAAHCPETVFHGTDVGHQYDTTGKRYLDYLKENQLEDSKQYQLAGEAIEQGKNFVSRQTGPTGRTGWRRTLSVNGKRWTERA